MNRWMLLILDGGALRTEAFTGALAAQGWRTVWADSADLLEPGWPDVVLFDPENLGPRGLLVLQDLRRNRPALPLVALETPGQAAGWLHAPALEPMQFQSLDRGAGAEAWASLLTGFLAGGAEQFSAEDLFADIIDELENNPDASEPAAPGSVPMAPAGSEPQAEPGPATPELAAPGPAAPGPAAPGPAAPEPAAPEAAEPMAEPVLEEFGGYNLLEKVAVGGMAELFKARQRGVHDFQKIVAIKRILPHLSDNDEFIRMFIEEAKLAAQLSHPNIVQIFDLGKAGGSYYIAMEFVDGRDLREVLRKVREHRRPMPEPLAATVAMRVAGALDYAHRKRGVDDQELRLVHRDISPQNILISYDGTVKLADFGIARAATRNPQAQGGALQGKLLYMSPEQAAGQPMDARSDLYSLGLVLSEMLTGERCFQADPDLGVLEKVRLGQVVPARSVNPDLSPEMAAILDKALQPDLERRYASARLLERDLKALLVAQGDQPTEPDLAEYLKTLFSGTREELDQLLTFRYPPRPVPEPPAPAAPAPAPAAPVAAPMATVPAPAPAPPLPPRPAQRRSWVWPLVGILAILAAAAAWMRLR